MPYEKRLEKAHQLLMEQDVEAVIVTSPANFFYFSGVWLDSYERLQAIVISKDKEKSHMIVPEMSVEEVASATHFEKRFWKDGENPLEIVANLLPDEGKVSIDNYWPSFQLLGLMDLKENLQYITSTSILGRLRLLKDEHEVQKLKESAKIADEVVEEIIDFVKPGMTEKEVVEEIVRLYQAKGASDVSFGPIVAAGANGAVPHHSPGETIIKDGDMIVLDTGCIKDHYCSDTTRTFVVGEPTEEMKKVHKIVEEALEAAFKEVKPGVPLKKIDQTARDVIEKAGYGEYFTHRTGHGLGIQVHEEPYVTNVNDQLLEEGMVFSIEPGIYLEGKFGVRIEDIVVVTSNGAKRLNHVDRHLIQV